MKKEKITIEQVIEVFANVPEGKEFTCAEIKKIVTDLFGNMEVIPSDYCYNRVNDGIDIDKNLREHRCLFEYVKRNRYKYIGVGKLYTGDLKKKPQGKPETVAGKITDSVVEWYE